MCPAVRESAGGGQAVAAALAGDGTRVWGSMRRRAAVLAWSGTGVARVKQWHGCGSVVVRLCEAAAAHEGEVAY